MIKITYKATGPGKFETSGSLGEWLQDLSMEGVADDEAGDVQDLGWYGLFKFPEGVEVEQDDNIWTFKAAILSEDTRGFVDVVTFDTVKKAETAWSEIEEMYGRFYEEQEKEEEEDEDEEDEGEEREEKAAENQRRSFGVVSENVGGLKGLTFAPEYSLRKAREVAAEIRAEGREANATRHTGAYGEELVNGQWRPFGTKGTLTGQQRGEKNPRRKPPHPKKNPGMGPMEERWRDGEVVVSTWFERDRAFVGIQDVETTDYLAEWWDEEVGEMVEDGFFKPHDDLSVIKYADEVGLPAYPK